MTNTQKLSIKHSLRCLLFIDETHCLLLAVLAIVRASHVAIAALELVNNSYFQQTLHDYLDESCCINCARQGWLNFTTVVSFSTSSETVQAFCGGVILCRSFAKQLGMPSLLLNIKIRAHKIRCDLYSISNWGGCLGARLSGRYIYI